MNFRFWLYSMSVTIHVAPIVHLRIGGVLGLFRVQQMFPCFVSSLYHYLQVLDCGSLSKSVYRLTTQIISRISKSRCPFYNQVTLL